jgi:hypothetical protein
LFGAIGTPPTGPSEPVALFVTVTPMPVITAARASVAASIPIPTRPANTYDFSFDDFIARLLEDRGSARAGVLVVESVES